METIFLTLTHVLVAVFAISSAYNSLDVSAEQLTSSAKRRDYLDNRSMSNRLLWTMGQPNKYLCLAECAKDDSCCSIFYNKATTKCQGHSITFGTTEDSADDQNTKYYVRPHGQQYIGDVCVTEEDCVTEDSECRSGVCMCVPGYSFSPRTRQCLAVCSVYGTEFLEVRDYFISQKNNDIFNSVSLADCFDLCLNRTEYSCISIEYGRSNGDCYLANITKLDWPSSWYPDSNGLYNISYYQRDCA